MPPPSNSTSLLPIQSSHNPSSIQLSSQKGITGSRSQTQHKSADTAGKSKAKTQQPNKLSELFRQVDGNGQVINTTTAMNSTTANPAFGNSSTQFVPKGSLSSSNNQQMLVRTMQMNNTTLAPGGAQVHNIQIKPISANKRRAAGPQNLIQANYLASAQQQ